MSTKSIEYPVVFRDDQVSEKIHGVEIKDPYRWLEDPDSEQTKKFVRTLCLCLISETKFIDYFRWTPKTLSLNHFSSPATSGK